MKVLAQSRSEKNFMEMKFKSSSNLMPTRLNPNGGQDQKVKESVSQSPDQ